MSAGGENRDGAAVTAFPLSLVQEGIWVSEQLAGTGSIFSSPIVLSIGGSLRAGLLENALAELLGRHDELRSRVSVIDGVPHIVTARRVPVPELKTIDVTTDGEWREHLEKVIAEPFDLLGGRLIRFTLYRLGEADHRLLVDVHHLVFDGISAGLLVRDLAELLAAESEGRAPRLPQLALTYGEYALTQRRSLAAGEWDEQFEYWSRQLDDPPAALALPADRERPARMSFRGASHFFTFPDALRESLRSEARRWSTTPFVVLLAGWAAVLARYAGQEDLIVGSPVSGRLTPGTENVIGMFANTVALRVRPARDDSFRALVDQVRRVSIESMAYQDAPIEQVVERLGLARTLGRNPLFRTACAYDEEFEEPIGVAGLTIAGDTPPARTAARFDLSIELVDRGGRLEAEIEYATDLFEAGTVEGVAENFMSFLTAALADADRALGDVPMASGPVTYGRAAERFTPTVLAAMFEKQVGVSPGAVAVVNDRVQWTYAELNERANRLARVLVARGVGPEDLVAVALPHGPLHALAVLAITKAGAAFLPIDLGHPAKRIEYMIADARPVLLLAASVDGDGGAGQWSLPTLILDERHAGFVDGVDASNLADEHRLRPLTVSSAAYAIYTSGSTGVPKGVLVTHAGLAGMAGSAIRDFGVQPGSRVLQFASPSFDASVSELCMALLGGATAVFAPSGSGRAGAPLQDLLFRERITHVSLPPSVLASLSLDDPLPDELTVVACGENLPADLARRWAERCDLFNAYGPTEITVCATAAGPLADDNPAPIGRPISGNQVFLLDEGLRPVPVGVVGDLYVTSDGLARGYLGLPGRTATGFVACLFGPPGARMYRTGDRARWRADGNLVYTGRADGQVKINGYRIELGEIENVITAYPGVKQAVVTVGGRRSDTRRILAHVVADVSELEILDHVRAHLPHYMVPASLILVDSFQLSANGKIDRNALPPPEAVAHREPTELERKICALIGEVLEVAAVRPDDSFLALGGNSLNAVRLLTMIRSSLGVEIGSATLFEAPTAALLAAEIESGRIARTTRPRLLPAAR